MPVNALATLLEAFFFFFFVDTHTLRYEGIALPLLHMCATSYLSVYVVAKNTGNTDDHKTDSIALWTERLTTRRTTRQIHCKAIAQPSFAHMHVLGNNAHQTLTGWFNNDSIWRNFRESSQEYACWRETVSYVEPLISNLHTHTHTHSSINLAMSLDFRNVSKWSALEDSNMPSWWHLRMNSNQQSRLEPTAHRVMGSPTTISHSLASSCYCCVE